MTSYTDPDDPVNMMEDEVAAAGALLIRYGDQRKAAQRLAVDRCLMQEEAEDHVGEAMVTLVASAPPEIRPSFASVCAWHRYQSMYEIADRRNRVEDMLAAQKAMDALLARAH
jgi:hypothetical protein